MPTMPKSLFWARTDTAGSEHVVFDDGAGLGAQGVVLAVDPIPYTCRYRLTVGPDWATSRLEVEAEGAGWQRSVRLEPAGDRWRVTAAEQGDLDAALRAAGHPAAGLPGLDDPDRLAGAVDVDLGGSPLFNTLPVRRLGLAPAATTTSSPGAAEPGAAHRITVAWVQVPSLMVLPAEQVYAALGPGRVRFASETFTTELDVDPGGWVLRYPGLAERIAPR
ncbi:MULTISPECIES: putative glycolipid-binding domain-containing protein [Micromonospora]|uniref:putative glycolipid-binding domain-containing protein n=1 Tax=Micromonospora TaxID=1873 RepID=UPI001E3912B2|nr:MULTISPECIES: putative glycolipid-binding domain-containing protein [unclassified Micromonospora]MDI5938052.1 putative glycolipid-binding domain-containing protein [Micromonospora sp. DH15]